MYTRIVACALLLTFSAWAQAPQSEQPKRSTLQGEGENGQTSPSRGPEVEFLNSQDAYWVTKGYNDMLYYGNVGSHNAARLERDQFRADQALDGIYKPTQIVEIKVNGKVTQPVTPTLRMGGKNVDLKQPAP